MSHHDLCPHCNQPWKRQRHKTVNALAAFCHFCAERKRKGIEWYAAQQHAALEKQAKGWVPYEKQTPEERAATERAWAAMWSTE